MNRTATSEPKTMLSRLGFADGDLTTPKHDEIMLWLDAGLRDGTISVPDWMGDAGERRWLEEAEDELKYVTDEAEKERLRKSLPKFRYRKPTVELTWEYPVATGRGFIVGYIDLLAKVRTKLLPDLKSDDGKRRWTIPELTYYWAFEVKTTIPSLGELLRQMQTYRGTLDRREDQPATRYSPYKEDMRPVIHSWHVVAPDDRFATPIRRQGFHFVKYAPRQKSNGGKRK